jgi:hypothetical protein
MFFMTLSSITSPIRDNTPPAIPDTIPEISIGGNLMLMENYGGVASQARSVDGPFAYVLVEHFPDSRQFYVCKLSRQGPESDIRESPP